MRAFRYIIVALVFLISLKAIGQNRTNIWQLGIYTGVETYPKCGINYNSGIADTFSLIRSMGFFSANGSICDTLGSILFYTDGVWVANRLNDTLQNSSKYNPGFATDFYGSDGLGISQAAIVLPLPGNSLRYYLFSVSGEEITTHGTYDVQPLSLRYSIIDMKQDSGLGSIDSSYKRKKAIVDTLNLGKLTACKHSNGKDWWVITHKYANDQFINVLVTDSGISQVKYQHIAVPIFYDTDGQACFSPNGNWYANVGPTDTVIILKFDRCTGLFSNPLITAVNAQHFTVGCGFSPDNRFLYVNSYDSIWQFDLMAPDIIASKLLVAQNDGFIDSITHVFNYFESQQLAPDNKIYICAADATVSLNVINNPNKLGSACNISQHSFALPFDDNSCVPNFPNYDLGPLGNFIADAGPNDTIVKGQSVQLGIPTVAGVKYVWSLNPTLSDTTIAQPVATPDTTTTYYVTFTDTSTFSSCNVREDTVTVFVKIATSAHAPTPQSSISVKVSPNPASHWLNIVYHSNDDALFELYNSFGEEVATVNLYHYFKNRMLDVSDLLSGVYNFRIQERNEVVQSGTVAVVR